MKGCLLAACQVGCANCNMNSSRGPVSLAVDLADIASHSSDDTAKFADRF